MGAELSSTTTTPAQWALAKSTAARSAAVRASIWGVPSLYAPAWASADSPVRRPTKTTPTVPEQADSVPW